MNREISAFLKDCIVITVSDDYESFETIRNNIALRARARAFEISEKQIARALLATITEGLVDAYVLSPTPPHSTKVEYSDEQLNDLWYYVSPRGKALVDRRLGNQNGGRAS